MAYPVAVSTSMATSIGAPSRERDPDCIENLLKQIEVNLSEALNSAANLADKIKGAVNAQGPSTPQPSPNDVHGRIDQINAWVSRLNGELTRAHNAISG